MASKAARELAAIDKELQKVHSSVSKRRTDLLERHLDEREPFLTRRYELVSGLSPVSEEELEGYTGPPAKKSEPVGLPCFWLNALCAEPEISQHITPADKGALAYVTDVRFLRGVAGMMMEFHFSPDNPYFENRVLRRGIAVQKDDDGEVTHVSEEATLIDWYEGKSLLFREVKTRSRKNKQKKKGRVIQRKGGKAAEDDASEQVQEEEAAAPTRKKPVPSFFRMFLPVQKPKVHNPVALSDEEDEGDEEHLMMEGGPMDDDESGEELDPRAAAAQRKANRDMALLDIIIRQVIPRAVHLYMASSPQGGEDEDAGPPADEVEAGSEGEAEFEVVNTSAAAAHGGGSALTATAQQVLYALQKLQDKLDASCLEFKKAKWQLSRTVDAEEQRLLRARLSCLQAGARPVQGIACKPGVTATTTTAPMFWLRALRASEVGTWAISPRDELALASLAGIQVSYDWDHMPTREEPWRKITVDWVFLDNPYFPACTLSKQYTFRCEDGHSSRLGLAETGEVVSGPAWYSTEPPVSAPGEVDPTAEEEDAGAGLPGKCDLTLSRGPNGKPHPVPSFFNMFKKGHLRYAFTHLEVEGRGQKDDEEALAAEGQLVADIMGGALYYAPCELSDQVDVDEPDLGHEFNEVEDEEEDEEDEEMEGDEEEDEDIPRGIRRRQRADKKAAGWALSKGTVFLIMVLLMIAAQLIVYIEMWLSGGQR